MPDGRLNIKNRDEYSLFVPSPIEHYRTTTRIKSVRFERISQDEVYRELKKKGLNIDITNPEIYNNGKKPMDGIFSPLFGADTTQDTPVFTCDCHKTTGGAKRGHICPHCGTEVRTIEADLRIQGHIDIAPYHIMSYHGYVAFSKIFKNLEEIITTTRRITRSGKVAKSDLPTIMDLYDDYDDLYAGRIGLDKDIVFMSKIPVYSARLRPLMKTNTQVAMLEVNKLYLSITNLRGNLKSTQFMPNVNREVEIQRTLNQIQQDFNGITAICNEQINSKSGVFRRALASGRLDNSSRLVITLGTDLQPHEVDVPYQLMMTQYEEEIANYYAKIQDVSIAKAIDMVSMNAMTPAPIFVEIINQLLKSKKGIWVLVNRNPTISESGVLYSRIRRIHKDYTDMTLHLPPDVLALLAADFDGDQMTSAGCKNPKYHPLFITMCPTYAFIDRADGKFNRAMDFKKDYSALIAAAWDIDTAYESYNLNPCQETEEVLNQMGLNYNYNRTDRDSQERYMKQVRKVMEAKPGKIRSMMFDPFGVFK